MFIITTIAVITIVPEVPYSGGGPSHHGADSGQGEVPDSLGRVI